MPTRASLCRACMQIVVALLAATPVHAQRALGWTPFDHWSRALLVRMHALGHGPAFDPTVAQPSAATAAAVSDSAARADVWLLQWSAERADGARLQLEGGPLLRLRHDAVRTGRFSLDRRWIEPARRADFAEPGAFAQLQWNAAARIGLTVHGSGHGSAWRADHATVNAAFDLAQLWVGRRAVGYAAGETGGLVLTRLPRVDGAGIVVHERAFRGIRAVGGELTAGRVPANGHVREPWLIALRLHATPHRRFDIGATRVAQFGGMDGHSVGIREIVAVLVSTNLTPPHADDQVASLDVRWRPAGPVAVELYGEWGVHDIDPGVLIDVPAFTIGARIPALPSLMLTVEHTQISSACCGNPPWYHHFEFADGWTHGGEPLGHPLGGQGREWRTALAAQHDRILLQAGLAARSRGAENLYAPTRAGRAVAFDTRADARLGAHTALVMGAAGERGTDWFELHAMTALRWWR